MDEGQLIHDWNTLGGFDWSTATVDLNDETLRDGLQSPSAIDPPIDIKLRFLHLMAGLGIVAADLGLPAPPKSHRTETLDSATMVKEPVRLDPSFDPRRTLNLGRVVEKWGVVPLAYLNQFANTDYTYAYLGSEDDDDE